MDINTLDLYMSCYAHAAYHEASTQQEIIGVFNVIRNRVKSKNYGNDPCEVVYDNSQFQGITDQSLWNGWACPWFTLETMRAIQAWVDDGINCPIEIEGDRVFDVYIDERIECRTITVDGVKYYSIDGWCWDEEEQS